MQQTSRRWLLRNATASLHEVVDNAVGTFTTLDEYRRYLPAQFRFRQSIEQHLLAQAWPGYVRSWRPVLIASEIAADMHDLGLAPAAHMPVALSSDADALMGIAYVLEGSGLGARVLYKRAQALGLTANYGARHLAVQAASPDSWRDFLALLEDAEPLDMERVAQASMMTFRHAESAFKGE